MFSEVESRDCMHACDRWWWWWSWWPVQLRLHVVAAACRQTDCVYVRACMHGRDVARRAGLALMNDRSSRRPTDRLKVSAGALHASPKNHALRASCTALCVMHTCINAFSLPFNATMMHCTADYYSILLYILHLSGHDAHSYIPSLKTGIHPAFYK